MHLLKPSIRLMGNLTYIKKFALIFAIILLPMSIMMGMFILQISKQLDYAKKQKIGLEYNIALNNLTTDIQKHRGLVTVFLSGDADFQRFIEKNEDNINLDIEKILELNKRYDPQLKVQDKWNLLDKEWIEVKNNLNFSPLEKSFEEHTKLIGDINDLVQYVADISELRIQSKIENYYLADNLINVLPQITEQMGEVRAIGTRSVAKKSLTAYDRESLEFITKLIKQELKDTEKSMQIISNHTSNKEFVEQYYKEAVEGAEEFIYSLNNNLLSTKNITIDAESYFSYATDMLGRIDKLSLTEASMLQIDYNEQIKQLELSRNIITLIIFTILFFIIYLFVGFYKSILGSILSIKSAAGRIAKGDLSGRIQLECKDEVKEIGDSVNKMLDKLIDNYYEVEKARALSEKVANHDWLTGVPNRAFFMKKLQETIEECREVDGKFTLLFLDLDRFKWINDNLGHQIGDIVLKEIAKRLVETVNKKGIVCRLGGDEFTIILKGIFQIEDVKEYINMIEESIEQPLSLSDDRCSVGASIGYVTYPNEGKELDELISKADTAMYLVKKEKKVRARD
ncbi:hypothetical protein CSC2_15670 [Clostridium zeae]|uniref:Diguanylate cyclase n=1 Tax=Clostridium zeae TaxID=2759022 RepID=A0ABQ1E8N5_9CLOT|nr:diguanylate cyclase [Clostridium zeae]GFZ31041.1 hypothetical protein CSC2_15670 [Clostridium zeae]